MNKFSIIVPIYNAEDIISVCLKSLINQTYNYIEIICIDDGSTDNSLEILNNFKKKDHRIIVLQTKKNKGVSNARNIGIKNATGNYILFVDADDWIDRNTCEILNDTISKYTLQPEIIQFCHKRILPKYSITTSVKKLLQTITNKNGTNLNNFIEEYLTNITYKGIWDKAYSINYLNKNFIRFPINVTHGEDALFMMCCCLFNPIIVIIDKALYNYNLTRLNSATKINSVKYFEKLLVYKDNIDKISINCLNNVLIKDFFIDDILKGMSHLIKDLYKDDYYIDIIIKIMKQITKTKLKHLQGYKLLNLQINLYKLNCIGIYWSIVIPIYKYFYSSLKIIERFFKC